MDPVYLRKDAIPAVPYAGEWVAGTAYPKGVFVTIGGILFMCNLAHTSATATQPYADPAVIYARAWRGAYSASTTYAKYDAVTYNRHAFYSLIENNIGHTPSSSGASNAYWGCYARGGSDGAQGAQGAQGDPGGDANHWAIQETPTGTMNGSNKSFTVAHTPTGMVELWWGSGLGLVYMVRGVDYTYSGTAVTLITFAPDATKGEYLKARYPYA